MRAKKGKFSLVRKFSGRGFTLYPVRSNPTKAIAESDAKDLRRQGYNARVIKVHGRWLVYQRRK